MSAKTKTCTECDRPSKARGLCTMHYLRARRAGTRDQYPLTGPSRGLDAAEVVALLDAAGLDHAAPLAPQFRELAPKLGMSKYTLERQYREYWRDQAARMRGEIDD